VLTAAIHFHRLPDGRPLLHDIEMDFHPGDRVAIVGPSGSGKSTLLGIIAGLIQPTSGTSGPWRGRRVAFIAQATAMLTARTVLANASSLVGMDRNDRLTDDDTRRVRHALEGVGLSSCARQKARELSGGELQRLSVARALASARPAILADEPTSQLDGDNARRVMHLLLGDAAPHDRLVVAVTHDLDAIPSDCHVMELRDGTLARLDR
jgi:ABC-type lipoprotein export system ATPase subunit